MTRRALTTLFLLALPLAAGAQEWLPPTQTWTSTPATGGVLDYEVCLTDPAEPEARVCRLLSNGPAFEMRLRALGAEKAVGPWSEPGRIVYIPEPSAALLLGAGVLGLLAIHSGRGRP